MKNGRDQGRDIRRAFEEFKMNGKNLVNLTCTSRYRWWCRFGVVELEICYQQEKGAVKDFDAWVLRLPACFHVVSDAGIRIRTCGYYTLAVVWDDKRVFWGTVAGGTMRERFSQNINAIVCTVVCAKEQINYLFYAIKSFNGVITMW